MHKTIWLIGQPMKDFQAKKQTINPNPKMLNRVFQEALNCRAKQMKMMKAVLIPV